MRITANDFTVEFGRSEMRIMAWLLTEALNATSTPPIKRARLYMREMLDQIPLELQPEGGPLAGFGTPE